MELRSRKAMFTRSTIFAAAPTVILIGGILIILNLFGTYPQISLTTMSRHEATELYVQRLNRDHGADWKVEINFFGKVLDENQQPVPGATANCEWNTLYGTSKSKVISNDAGLFSLTGERGKMLEVRVSKEGYYTADGGAGALAFEFANPAENDYYEPDSAHPVIFHLHKMGPGAALVSRRIDVTLDADHPSNKVNLMTGRIGTNGSLTVEADKPDYRKARGRFPWSITLSMSEGGLVETNAQFPFQAPESGYSAQVVMDLTNPDSPSWTNMLTKTYYFYLPSSKTYGRMTVDTLGASRHVAIDYSYNPVAGHRELEPRQGP